MSGKVGRIALLLATAQFGERDIHFRSVKSLAHFEGGNATTVFHDTKLVTWAATGGVEISTEQAKFGASSAKFLGNGFLSTPHSARNTWALLNGRNTLETWVFLTSLPTTGQYSPICAKSGIGSGSNNWELLVSSTGTLRLRYWSSGSERILSTATSLPLNTWAHIAVVAADNKVTIYIDGVPESTAAIVGTPENTALALNLGAVYGGTTGTTTAYLNGFLDEFRYTEGVARYIAAFIPPQQPFPDFAPLPDGSSVRSKILAKNPVWYCRHNQTSGTVAENLGSGADGTYQGTVVLGKPQIYPGGDVCWDTNSTGYVDIPASILPTSTSTFTLLIVFRTKNSIPTYSALIDRDPESGGTRIWQWRTQANGTLEWIKIASGIAIVTASTAITINNTTILSLVVNNIAGANSKVTQYAEGIEQVQATVADAEYGGTGILRIGRRVQGDSQSNMLVSDTAIFKDTALTEQELYDIAFSMLGEEEHLAISASQSTVYSGTAPATAETLRDGNYTTGGGTQGSSLEYIALDLGENKVFSRVQVAGGNLPNWGGVAAYLNGRTIEYATAESPTVWVNFGTVADARDTAPYYTEVRGIPVLARYVRVRGNTYVSTSEFRVFNGG